MVAINSLARRLSAYKRWCEGLADTIREYQHWMEQNGLADGAEDLRVYELMDMLRSDKLTVALVAEFSRGKTELINAIFFADYKQRLLPSEAGRTTMCPTELLYDDKLEPCIRLLRSRRAAPVPPSPTTSARRCSGPRCHSISNRPNR